MKDFKKRIDYIDIFKALAIILVIIGHIYFANKDLKPYIYSFHMPLFFFIYGVIYSFKISKENYNYSFKKSVQSKVASLIVPYFVWALIFCEFTPKNIFYIIYGSHQSLGINSNSSLWFLPCYFISTIIFEIIIKIIKTISRDNNYKFNIFTIIFLLLSIIISCLFQKTPSLGIPWGFNISFMGIAFMLLGIIIKPIIDLLIKFKNIKLILISIMTFLGTLCFMFNDIKYVLMAENNYGNLLIFLPTAICGCLLILCLSILIDHLANKQLKNLLVFLGKNTLVIFACHKQFISLMNSIFSKLSFNIPNLVSITITTTLSIIFCSIIIILINQYIPSLNGKSNSK